ncbi:putative aminoacyltransferase, E1 ubiquitin-activating enzyme [Medicago truncatula]|uniref:RING-type E3 ubiquitin transferase n=1 Tax=Medicago truncatula TaxID=3880 RepID=G7K2E0_MEDTR|nr:zinc finger, C3HC4 type (RING finger) protein [Medicago truncatula]RHN53304.1 putative aminoacyltransferase, E1 ubiquitin-activating enzyme [Medicago truncatula]
MDRSYISLHVSHVHEPILLDSKDIPSLGGWFLINFDFTHIILPSDHDATTSMSNSAITMNKILAIPIEILCNCTEGDHNNVLFLYDTFDFVATNILDVILPDMEQCARQMVLKYGEGHDILEMNMSLHVDTLETVEEEEEEDDRNFDDNGQQAQQIAGLLEKLENNYHSSHKIGQCSICLEEFCTELELAYTKCSHVFHQKCIRPWIQKCINRSSSYSCPLCRGQII